MKRSFTSSFSEVAINIECNEEEAAFGTAKSSRRAVRTIKTMSGVEAAFEEQKCKGIETTEVLVEGTDVDVTDVVVAESTEIFAHQVSSSSGAIRHPKKNAIFISASDVSAIVGKNRYKSREDVLELMWQRYAPHTKTFLTTSEAAMKTISSEKSGETLKVFKEATTLAGAAMSSSGVQDVIKNATEKVKENDNLSLPEKQLVIELLRSSVSTTFGTIAERRTANIEQNQVSDIGIKVVEVEETFTMPLIETEHYQFYLVGRIDRLEFFPDGKIVLVEIKNRVNRLFRRVPPYEYVQVQVYLKLLDLKEAKLIEQFNGDTMKTDIVYDSNFFQTEIIPDLFEFAFTFERILVDSNYHCLLYTI